MLAAGLVSTKSYPTTLQRGVAYQINFNDSLAWSITAISVTVNISGATTVICMRICQTEARWCSC